MSTPVVRPATPDDAAAVVRLEHDNLGPDAWSDALIRDGLAGDLPTLHVLVAEVDGVVVGHAVASVLPEMAELQRIAVDATHRRAGVASALLAAVEQSARAGDADRLLLEVREGNGGAISFYAERGFVAIDRRPRYYRDGTAALVMRRDLGLPRD